MDLPNHSSIYVLHTATPTALNTPQSIEHRCTEYHYTKYISIAQCNPALVLPSQLSTDALHTATPTARSGPPVNQAQMPCILLHPLLDLGQCIYIEGR